jgi:hypothetical protein
VLPTLSAVGLGVSHPLQGGISLDQLQQPETLFPALFVVVFGGIGVYMTYRGASSIARGGRVVAGDPIDAGEFHLAEGNVEVEGTAQPLGETIAARYTDTEVVGYTYERKERRHDHDPNGQNQTHWETVDSGGDAVPFEVVDDTGSVAVDPEGADLTFDTERAGGGSGTRTYEGRLEPGSTVYVNGVKRDAADSESPLRDARAVVAGGEDLVVSDTSEGWTAARYLGQGVGQLLFGLIFAGVGVFVAASMLGVTPFDPSSFF